MLHDNPGASPLKSIVDESWSRVKQTLHSHSIAFRNTNSMLKSAHKSVENQCKQAPNGHSLENTHSGDSTFIHFDHAIVSSRAKLQGES